MKIELTNQESEQMFHDALCNGLSELGYHDCELEFLQSEYKKAKNQLMRGDSQACYEDILMQILRNGSFLRLVDCGECEEPSVIHLKDVHERVSETPFNHLADAIQGNDDACTADAILQTVFFREVIFG